MTMLRRAPRLASTRRLLASATAALALLAPALHAQTAKTLQAAPNRLRADASFTQRMPLDQAVSRHVTSAALLGHLAGDTPLQTMALVLAPSTAQAAALDQLLAAQQTPGSSHYHQWLTPAQFGTQFGLSDADLSVLQNWLTAQGFQVGTIAPSRNRIEFSGSAALVESAFQTTLNRYNGTSQQFFENSTTLQIPAAFASVVTGVTGLSSYRLRPHGIKQPLPGTPRSAPSAALTFTTSQGTVTHNLVPFDVRQIYDANNLIGSGFNGSGVKIGVIGQTAVDATQLSNFKVLTGQAASTPSLILVPNTGASTLYTGDEGEAEADLEYAGGVAPGAGLVYIYTGSSSTADVLTALEYAITTNAAQIVTLSYGSCEAQGGSNDVNSIETYLRQASAQGQTVLNSTGDTGAAACDGFNQTTAYGGLQVSYPASSPFVTAIGGTILNDTNASWNSTNNSQNGSAVGYIPELAWNETSTANGLSATGGGASVLFSKPNWQTGPGVPADGARDIPDISFSSSVNHDPYLLCTADPSFSQGSGASAISGACTTGNFGSYAVGGTSLATPSFAGMLAIVEQANGGGALGNINPRLYALSTSNPSVFHDITSGTNQVPCAPGTTGCVGNILGYTAAPGYDLVTGLGSLDIGAFATAVKAAAAAPTPQNIPTVTIALTSATATNYAFRVTVGSSNSTTTPTGTVSISIDGGAATSLPLSNGAVSYPLSTTGLASGNHTIAAAYTGDATYAAATSSSTFTFTVATGTYTLTAAPALTITRGSTGTELLTLTSNGFSGLLNIGVSQTGATTPNVCLSGIGTVSISAGSTLSLNLSVDTNLSNCGKAVNKSTVAALGHSGNRTGTPTALAAFHPATSIGHPPAAPWIALTIGTGLFGGLATRRRRRAGSTAPSYLQSWTPTLLTGLLIIACTTTMLGVAGCGNGAAPLPNTPATTTPTPTAHYTPAGTYTLTVSASTPSNTLITTAPFTLSVQ